MTSIQLEESTARAITAIATARNMTVEEYLRSLVANDMPLLDNGSPDEFERALAPLLFDGPTLPADFSRAEIYADHD